MTWRLDNVGAKAHVGLTSDPDAGSSTSSIDYRIYIKDSGSYTLYDTGGSMGISGTVSAGDVFSVQRVEGKIYYVHNGDVVGEVVDANNDLLFGHSVFYNRNEKIDDVSIQGAVNVGDIDEDGLPDQFELDLAANSGGQFTWIDEIFPGDDFDQDTVSNLQEYLDGSDPTDSYDTRTWRAVDWTDFVRTEQVNGTNGGNGLVTEASGSGGADAISTRRMTGNGLLQWQFGQTNENVFIGLATSNPNQSSGSIDYAIRGNGSGVLRVYEGGTSRGDVGSYTTTDQFEIRRIDGQITYWKLPSTGGEELLYTSEETSTGDLLVDTYMSDYGGVGFDEVKWRGAVIPGDVDEDGMGDQFELDLISNSNGLYTSIYQVQPSDDFDQDTVSNLQEYLDGSDPTDSYDTRTWRAVDWTEFVKTEQVNGTNGGNGVVTEASGSGGADAISTRRMAGNGLLQWQFSQTNENVFIGLATSNPNQSSGSIDYAIRGSSSGVLRVYEGGSSQGDVGSYSIDDQFEIRRIDGQITYWKLPSTGGEELLYTSEETSTGDLLVDTYMSDYGGVGFDEVKWRGAVIPGDVDEDGMGDQFELDLISNSGGTYTSIYQVQPNDDYDGDSRTNLQEYIDWSDPTDANSKYDFEEVDWTNLVKTQETLSNDAYIGSSLDKISGGSSWNAGAESTKIIAGNGAIQFRFGARQQEGCE